MIAEVILSSFWEIENEISFHFIVKTKVANLNIWKREKHLKLSTVHFKYEILMEEVLRIMMIRK